MDCWKKLGIPLIALVFTFTLGMFATGCGGGGSSSGTNIISGQGSKGPFVKGSTVTAYELDSKGARTGTSQSTTTTDDLGSYTLTVSWSGPTEIVIKGKYLDELTGIISDTDQELAAVEDLPPVVKGKSNPVTANPNVVTAVAAKLAKTSLAKGVSVATAIESSKSSALSFLGLPTKDKITGKTIDPAKLDLSNTADTDFGDTNAKLLAVSAAIADTFNKSTGLTDVTTLLDSFATDIEKGNTLGTAADASGAKGAGGATIAVQITTSITTVNTSIATIVTNINKVITDTKGSTAVDTKLTATLTTAVTDVKADVQTTLKGFTLSGNTISETSVSSGQTWTINSDGTTTVAGAPATGTAVTISGILKDRTKDGTASAGASSSAATFSFYIASTGDSRKISGSLSPVNIVVDSAGVVTVSVPANAVLTFSGTTTAGTTVSGTATNVSADTIITTSSLTGVFSINASNLLATITNKINNNDLNILQTAGTFNFEFGFSGIEIGHETAGGSLDTLFPATSTNVGGRVISGTIVTK